MTDEEMHWWSLAHKFHTPESPRLHRLCPICNPEDPRP